MDSPKSNTLSIHSPSSRSMVPRASPRSTIMRISSSVTVSSSALVLRRMSLSRPLVDTDSSHTAGRRMAAMPRTTPQEIFATCMGFCMAMRLGTSSPNTRVK